MNFLQIISDACFKKPPEMASAEVPSLNQFFDRQFFPYSCAMRRRPELAKYIYDKHMRPEIGLCRLDRLDRRIIDDWIRKTVEAGYKIGTVNQHIFILNRILKVANEWDILSDAVYRRCLTKRLPMGDFRQVFLTPEELSRVLTVCEASAHPFLYFFVRLLVLTGARSSEVRLARWCDINPGQRLWTVPVSKNGRSRRIVVSHAAMQTLDQLKEKSRALRLPTGADDFILLNPRFRKPYNTFFLAWDRARIVAGLPQVRIHDLRHTYASILINNGATIYEVQTLLGHHHVSMTERYAHLQPNTLAQRVEIVSAVLK